MLNEKMCALPEGCAVGLTTRKTSDFHQGRNLSRIEKNRKHLLQGVKTAVLALAILIALCIKAEAQQLLTAQEIKTQIIGHSFQGRKGILSVTLHYARDGTVTMQSPIGAGAGNWTLSENQLCVKLLSGPRKANECMTFVSQQDGTYRASNGMQLTVMK